jgi:hypothetical protein
MWFIDLSGKHFGRLKVLHKLPRRSWGSIVWRCKCSCGRFVSVNGACLRDKKTQSCGCYMRETCSQKNSRPEAARNKVRGMYVNHAKTISAPFSLTGKQFDNLIFGNCYYCDSPPSRVSTSFAGNSVLCNGIDRINSTLGYTKHNCVSCCQVCNMMKKAYTLEFFLSHVKRIASHTRGLYGKL